MDILCKKNGCNFIIFITLISSVLAMAENNGLALQTSNLISGELKQQVGYSNTNIHEHQLENNDIDNIFSRAQNNVQSGKYNEAITDCDKLVNQYNYLPGLVLRGCAYMGNSNYDMAASDFTKALQVKPSAELYFLRAETNFKNKDYVKAIEDFNQHISIKTNNAYAYLFRGNIYFLNGNSGMAISNYTEAIQYSPDYAEAYANRGQAYCKIGVYEKGVADFEAAIKIDSTCIEAYNNIAWQFAVCPDSTIRNGQKALNYANKACELSKWSDALCVGTLAAAYAENGNFKEAVSWEKKSISLGLEKNDLKEARERLDLYEQNKPYRAIIMQIK